MKTTTTKRKAIADAVELLKEESPNAPGNIAGVQLIPIEKVRAFKDHPFRLYEGERLDDMVQSVRDHGILNPVIVRKVYGGYEMLAGHNRMNAAQIAGMTEVPAIVKADLSDEDAYVYVIETNVIQRSFTDLAPSEKAAVLSARYEKVISQGRRNDILKEIEEIGTCGHDVHKSRSRDSIGEEYGMTGRNIARYMRVDKLIRPFKDRLNAGELTLTAAVELSYAFNNEPTRQSQQVIERLRHILPGQNAFTADLPDELKLNIKGAKISQIYKRLDPEKPSYTVTGSGGGGTHIYHWEEPRALTNRERARLQTFPDDYEFLGSKESVRKQIGMAVPCQGAKIIFEAILKCFAGVEYDATEASINE